METYFFDFTVNSAYLTSDYAGYTPAEGNVLLVADITVKNTFQQSFEMYDVDFQAQWDDGDDAFAYPITTDMETYTEVDPPPQAVSPRSITAAAASANSLFFISLSPLSQNTPKAPSLQTGPR